MSVATATMPVEPVRAEKPENLTVVNHSMLKCHLTTMRMARTGTGAYRAAEQRVSFLLAEEALRHFPLRSVPITTPLEDTEGWELDAEALVVSVLRAGMSLEDGFVFWMPDVPIAHLGLFRGPDLKPQEYSSSVPGRIDPETTVYVVDPMLATAGSVIYTIEKLKKAGARKIVVVCVVTCPDGIRNLLEAHPDAEVFAAAEDPILDENGYIRPGLGDAGDRHTGTKRHH